MFSENWFRSSVSSDHLIHPPLGSSPKIPEGTAWKRPIVAMVDETRLTLWPVDPYRIFAAVRIADSDPRINQEVLSSLSLRVLDITPSRREDSPSPQSLSSWEEMVRTACHTFDISLGQARSWYIPLWDSERTLTAFLGWFGRAGAFHPLQRANIIRTSSGKVHRSVGILHHQVGPVRKESLSIDPNSPSFRLLRGMVGRDSFFHRAGSSDKNVSSLQTSNFPSSSEYRSRP